MANPKKYLVDPVDGLPVEPVHNWALDKHQRLRRYIDASSQVRNRFVREWKRRPAFIDLYCGPGRAVVDETREYIAGSALVAADEAAKRCPFSQIIVADRNPTYVDASMSRLRAAGHGNVLGFAGTAEETASEVVRVVEKQTFHVAFLDPFSLHALPFSIIDTLASSLTKVDLLIHFSVMDFRRNLEAMKKDGRLELIVPGWESACGKNLGVNRFRDAIFAYWCELIYQRGYKQCKRIESVRGPKGAELYWLLLFSRHPLGSKLWDAAGDLGGQGKLDL